MAPDPTFAFVGGPWCPTLDFVIAFWIMIYVSHIVNFTILYSISLTSALWRRNEQITISINHIIADSTHAKQIPYFPTDSYMFVCLFIAARAIFQLSGGCHHCRWQGCKFWPMLGTQGLWAGRDLYRATPTATLDCGFYGLIRKTGTHVPQWDSNPRRKDHQMLLVHDIW
jgi:hypothetical protein